MCIKMSAVLQPGWICVCVQYLDSVCISLLLTMCKCECKSVWMCFDLNVFLAVCLPVSQRVCVYSAAILVSMWLRNTL